MKAYVASHLKDMNRHIVYNLINELEVTSKAQISKMTGISAPTVIKIISFLAESGLIVELGEGKSSIGRKPHMLTLNKDMFYSAVFFLEGELLDVGIADIAGTIKYKKTLRYKSNLGEILNRIASGLVDGLFAEAGIDLRKLMGIGIAIPGIYDPTIQTIITAPLVGVNEPVCISSQINELEQKYGVQVLVENDVNCQTYGEFKATKMSENSDLLLISVGTGLGAGLILNGKLRHGVNYMCGEIGYMSFMDKYISGFNNPGWLENKVSLRVLEEKFGVSYGMDLEVMPQKELDAILEYVSIPLALCICNITMMLDCPNVRLSGVVADLLGNKLFDCINKKLTYMCINKIEVQSQSSKDIGLIGISAMLTEKHISQLLMERD